MERPTGPTVQNSAHDGLLDPVVQPTCQGYQAFTTTRKAYKVAGQFDQQERQLLHPNALEVVESAEACTAMSKGVVQAKKRCPELMKEPRE
jgi:hypothetical protein